MKASSFGSLYKNRKGENFLLYQENNQGWVIEKNKSILEQTFESFDEGERFLKRNFAAWLVKDEQFVTYLMKEVKPES